MQILIGCWQYISTLCDIIIMVFIVSTAVIIIYCKLIITMTGQAVKHCNRVNNFTLITDLTVIVLPNLMVY